MAKSCSTSEKNNNNGLKKGPWTPEEDQKLIDYIQKHGHGKWRTLPKNAGLKRCGKSCRLRWANYLRPDIKRGRFSFEEEEMIIQLHSVLGNKWSTIAANLPGRTDNEIKNYWNTHIKKRLLKMGIDPVTHTPRLDVLQLSSILSSTLYNNNNNNNNNNYPTSLFGIGSSSSVANNPSHVLSLLTSLLSYQSRNNYGGFSQNQIGSISPQLLQNQMQLNPSQAFQPNQPCANNLHVESQNMKSKLEPQIPSISYPFSHQNTLPNLWHYNGGGNNMANNQQGYPSLVENNNQILCNNSEGIMANFNLMNSMLSSSTASSSSPSNLNSSSSTTFVNGTTTEDERDSYGSNMLMYNISNGLNNSAFL
ncbi:hypothetical protein PIB30_046045 [Stylosanthes scabra]|uniref:Uncharacterized protein n=1 Tax=Stylosanthes scabra TaxID=79078 RepID=A0ABU6QFZ5_9FABA|nr:hypothetical protein [Stylosanthes scabra]